MSYQLCCIGHITQDKVVTPGKTVFMPGGTAFYFSHAITGLCKNYLLLTKLADSEMQSVKELEERGVQVKRLPSKQSVYFENSYGENPDERQQRVLQQADPFSAEDFASLNSQIFHVGPLLANDLSADAIITLAKKGKVSLDVQGLLRNVEDEAVIPVNWKTKTAVLPHIHFLKANEEEVTLLTGRDNIDQGAKQLADWGVREVIITLGSKGSCIYFENRPHPIKSFRPSQVVDATGCGDTYMAGYLFKRMNGAGINEAGEFAAPMASLKLAFSGPFKGSEEDVYAAFGVR